MDKRLLIIELPANTAGLPPGIEALLKSADVDLHGSCNQGTAEARDEDPVAPQAKKPGDPFYYQRNALQQAIDERDSAIVGLHKEVERLKVWGHEIARGEHDCCLRRERDRWVETCAQQAKDLTTYQKTLDHLGLLFGEEVFICDDGSLSDTVLRAKVPELVENAIKELWGYRLREASGRAACEIAAAPVDMEAPREKCSCPGPVGVFNTAPAHCVRCGNPTV